MPHFSEILGHLVSTNQRETCLLALCSCCANYLLVDNYISIILNNTFSLNFSFMNRRLGYIVDLEDRRGKDEQRVDEGLHLWIYKVNKLLIYC